MLSAEDCLISWIPLRNEDQRETYCLFLSMSLKIKAFLSIQVRNQFLIDFIDWIKTHISKERDHCKQQPMRNSDFHHYLNPAKHSMKV
jgi:hypothetical protein